MVNELKRFFPRVGKDQRGNGFEKFWWEYYENGVGTLHVY